MDCLSIASKINEICRLCLREGKFKSIFGFADNVIQYSQKVMFLCSNIKVSHDDHLPSFICDDCIPSLNTSYNFKQQCEEADSKLRKRILNEHKQATEISINYIEMSCDNKSNLGIIKKETKLYLEKNDNIGEFSDGCDFIISNDFDCFSNSSNVSYDAKSHANRKKSRLKNMSLNLAKNIKKEPESSTNSSLLDKIGFEAQCNESPSEVHNLNKNLINSQTEDTVKQSTNGSDNNFQCKICFKISSSKSSLITHMRIHSGEKPCKCDICEKAFATRSNLERHLAVHKGLQPYCCHVCGHSFALSRALKIHMRTHTGEKPYQCLECGAQFSQPGSLVTHKRRHSGEHPFVCVTCGVAFTSHGGLARHKRTHTGEKRAQCSVCGKKFGSLSYLPKHMRLHTGEKPFKCKDCGKEFRMAENLSVHARSHEAKGAHVCGECGRSCTDLRSHLRTHSGERPYVCPHCSKRFTQYSNLKYHITIHTGERKFGCQFCSKKFKTKEALKGHTTTHTGERPFNCDVCNNAFRSASSRRKHIKKSHHTLISPSDKINDKDDKCVRSKTEKLNSSKEEKNCNIELDKKSDSFVNIMSLDRDLDTVKI